MNSASIPPRPGLPAFEAFLVVARHGSFRKAAAARNVTPSALSHIVRGLEDSLDVRLFDRTNRSIRLTMAGEHLRDRIGPALADIYAAIDPPGPGGRVWGDTTICGQPDRGTGILNNPIYRGMLELNRCSYGKEPRTGKRLAQVNKADQREFLEVPQLRILIRSSGVRFSSVVSS